VRYGGAILIAVLIIAGIGLFVWRTLRQFDVLVRETLRQQQEAGQAPPQLQNVDGDSPDLRDFNMRLPAREQARIDLAQMLAATWYVWAPMTIAACLSGAAVFGWIRSKRP
jgi:hypothetical protein